MQLTALENIRKSLAHKGRDGERFLVSLTTDEPPLAAVSIGDLDTASNVTWAVPGMGSSSEEMTGWTNAAQNLFDEQGSVGGPDTRAVIAWMGYEAPPIPVTGGADFGVFGTEYAAAGGKNLALSIRGLDATRSTNMPTTNVLAHSYGTTTASLGLTRSGVHVDTFTTIASAGISDSIADAQAIHADNVYSGQARNVIPGLEDGSGDQYAAIGRDFSTDHHQDPTDPDFGATTFGTDGDDGQDPVTDHGVHMEDGAGYLDPGTESLTNVALATSGGGDKMTPYTPKEPTALQQALIDSARNPVPH